MTADDCLGHHDISRHNIDIVLLSFYMDSLVS